MRNLKRTADAYRVDFRKYRGKESREDDESENAVAKFPPIVINSDNLGNFVCSPKRGHGLCRSIYV